MSLVRFQPPELCDDASHASMAKPPAFNRQMLGSIPWRGTGCFSVKLTRLKRRAENAEELVRLQPPGLTKAFVRSAVACLAPNQVAWVQIPPNALPAPEARGLHTLPNLVGRQF